MTLEKPREIACRVLRRRENGADFVERLLEDEWRQQGLSPSDRGLIQELTCGVVRWQSALDWLIDRRTGGRTQKPILRILLRLGLYQIFWLDRIPNHAAVHETVEMAKRMGFGQQAGFLNAVLRGYLREEAGTRRELEELKSRQPALGYSHPEWLCQRWRNRWEADTVARLCEWNNAPPPTFARVNTLRTDAESLLTRWRDEGVQYDFVRRDWMDENLVFALKSHPPLGSLPSLRQGWFYVQDPSTLLAVQVLNPQPGEQVLDLCAAPGGKTTFAAQRMQNQGTIVACDRDSERLATLRANCVRLGLECAQLRLAGRPGDSGAPASEPAVLFDRILVDAPCTNTGVMRRRVDLRWRLRVEEIDRLRKGQTQLLEEAAPQLKIGGILVYSTCSLEPEENGGVVREFLSRHPEFRVDCERELLPFRDAVDGAYVARLIRTAAPCSCESVA